MSNVSLEIIRIDYDSAESQRLQLEYSLRLVHFGKDVIQRGVWIVCRVAFAAEVHLRQLRAPCKEGSDFGQTVVRIIPAPVHSKGGKVGDGFQGERGRWVGKDAEVIEAFD